ncbi:transcriptional regulator, TetR family [Collimonas sp. OK607]|uniref:TetR/AcrR family transcriptional regulator n=1 Tax=Collimonas sp. OK607 TaxID=1798194 RepID=UPI0008E12CDA|nr:TetR/AcrR family transcriptional regulator [Collimonas sp. OK607]SFA82686.1 transcriptional regulator, TetR family [Collimonas sp. OK607]
MLQSRRERNKSNTLARLLDAARQLFAEKGVTGTTIDDITDRADVGRATFFNYFQSKDAVLQALWIEQVSNFSVTVDEQLALRLSTGKRIENLFRAFEAGTAKWPDYLKAVTGELEREWNTQATGRYRLERFHAALAPLIEAGIVQGDMRTDYAADFLIQMIGSAYLSVVRYWRLYPDDDLPARITETTRFLSEVIRPVAKAGTPT